MIVTNSPNYKGGWVPTNSTPEIPRRSSTGDAEEKIAAQYVFKGDPLFFPQGALQIAGGKYLQRGGCLATACDSGPRVDHGPESRFGCSSDGYRAAHVGDQAIDTLEKSRSFQPALRGRVSCAFIADLQQKELEDECPAKPTKDVGATSCYLSSNAGGVLLAVPALGQTSQIDNPDWPLRSFVIHWPDGYTPADADLLRTMNWSFRLLALQSGSIWWQPGMAGMVTMEYSRARSRRK